MLTIKYETTFKKDFKRVVKRGYHIPLMETVIDMLANEIPLPPKYKDHPLSGNYADCRECHITPDWLLVYKIDNDELI
jgi:mRNA interferase YafQ